MKHKNEIQPITKAICHKRHIAPTVGNINTRHLPMKRIFLTQFFIFISILSFGQREIKFSEIRPPYKSISPVVSELIKIDENNLQNRIDIFWEDAKINGLPLVEKDSLYSDYVWITLIHRDSTENKDISFEVFGIYSEYRFGDMKMHRLKNTDLYYRSYMVPNDMCFSYRFIVKDTVSNEISKSVDHYNYNLIPTVEERNFSYSVLDLNAFNADWNTKRYYDLNSKIDTIEYTDNIVAKNRNIYIYLPPDYDENRQKPYPVIYLFDAFIYLNRVEVPNILDNLITEGKIEPMIAVLFGTYNNTRGILLPINFEFKNEFITVIVPLISEKYNISLNPKYNIIGGMSYGGLAATFIAFYHPDVFGKVLSQSGSFWRGIELSDSYGNEVRNDWMINQFIKEDKKTIDIFLDWGLQENMVLGSNRKMVRILNKKNYKFDYIEFNGWHDWSNSRKTFPIGLMYLLEKK